MNAIASDLRIFQVISGWEQSMRKLLEYADANTLVLTPAARDTKREWEELRDMTPAELSKLFVGDVDEACGRLFLDLNHGMVSLRCVGQAPLFEMPLAIVYWFCPPDVTMNAIASDLRALPTGSCDERDCL